MHIHVLLSIITVKTHLISARLINMYLFTRYTTCFSKYYPRCYGNFASEFVRSAQVREIFSGSVSNQLTQRNDWYLYRFSTLLYFIQMQCYTVNAKVLTIRCDLSNIWLITHVYVLKISCY